MIAFLLALTARAEPEAEPEAEPQASSTEPAEPEVPAPPADVEQVIAQGVVVDWTRMELHVHTTSHGAAIQTFEAVEQLARRQVDAAIGQAAPKVRVTTSARVSDLLADARLGPSIEGRLTRWDVAEAVYGTSHKVELRAVLSLQELLKPWALQIARAGAAPPAEPSAPTGLVVDARGTGVEPAYALRLLGPTGTVLYAGELYEEEAVTVAPFLYVLDPAHPEAARAGDRPVLLRAVSASASDLTLDAAGAARVTELSDLLLGRAPVVVVLDVP
ncbi:MAG: hypothetical protein H6735_11720 [Alphaproteobacteria bacterium]|nr:hypothetical protein [Alphaproteobacteria bacterium]